MLHECHFPTPFHPILHLYITLDPLPMGVQYSEGKGKHTSVGGIADHVYIGYICYYFILHSLNGILHQKKITKKSQVMERNSFSALAFPNQIGQIQRTKSTPAVTQLRTEKKVLQPPELQPGTPGAKSRVCILPAVGRCSHLSGQQQAWLEVGPCFQNKNKILQLSPHLKTSVSKITHGEGKDNLQSSG